MNQTIVDNMDEIRALCRRYGVLRLDLFGSATTDAFVAEASDFDFVVTFANTRDPGYADRYFGMAESLEGLLGRPVDLVVERANRNRYLREEVEASRRTIYDRPEPHVAVGFEATTAR